MGFPQALLSEKEFFMFLRRYKFLAEFIPAQGFFLKVCGFLLNDSNRCIIKFTGKDESSILI